ncbi:MAG: ComEC/Rec2 family competence protein [Planctomycetota bacterium]
MTSAEQSALAPPQYPSPWLPFLALGLVVGACAPGALNGVLGWGGSALLWWWALGAPLALIAAGCARIWPYAARWMSFAATLLLGGALAAPGGSPPMDQTRLLSVRGEVVSVKWQGYEQAFSLQRITAIEPASWIPAKRMFVRAPATPGVRPGDVVTVGGVWSYARSTTASGAWRVSEPDEQIRASELSVEPREHGPRGFAWQAIDRLGEHRELGAALLLGRGDPPERGDFRRSGLAHVLAVSGVHLVIAAGVMAWLMRAFGFGWWPRLLMLGGLLCGYTWLTHASPATVRAGAMALAVIAYAMTWREAHRLGPVALAVVVLIAWDPTMANDLGFQLSLAAVLGLVTLGMDLIRLREQWLPLQPWPLDRPSWIAVLWSSRAVVDGLAIGIAATLATAPLIVWHIGQVAPWSWLTSIVASIPATIALWAGLPLMICAGIWPNGPWEGLYRITEWSLDSLAASAAWGAQHLPQEAALPPPAWIMCAWPLLFVRLRDGWDLVLRIAAGAVLVAAWAWC